jgi:hypothetical protein
MVIRYEDHGVVTFIPPDVDSPDYQDYLTWKDTTSEEQNNAGILRRQATTALQTNRDQTAQNAAVISGAASLEQFQGTSLTQAQIISALKQLAAGVRILAEHDQSNKAQLNGLIRLVVGDFNGLD